MLVVAGQMKITEYSVREQPNNGMSPFHVALHPVGGVAQWKNVGL